MSGGVEGEIAIYLLLLINADGYKGAGEVLTKYTLLTRLLRGECREIS